MALRNLYGYFGATEQMLSNVFRDAPQMPEMRDPFHRALQRFDSMAALLASGWVVEDEATRRALLAAIRLGLDFNTWRLLVRAQRLPPDEAVEMMVSMISCIAGTTTESRESP
ncbi:hypothetical protein BH23CHL4_BH23CHL4_26910 [soil metagenome]